VGVCLDEDAERARAFLAAEGNPFRSAFNGGFWNGTVARAYGVQAIPRSFLVGPDGRILQREVFPSMLLEERENGR
jgi:cytochrome c biogenesis protein CcmG, thiol:disulfide interchange protein DsbE